MARPLYFDTGNNAVFETIKVQTCSGQPLEVTTASGTSPVQITPAGTTAGDAFGRLRISNPVTLFDSSHRYSANGNWNFSGAVNGAQTFNADQGLIELTTDTSSGSLAYRETNKVFAYQPGKSLLVMATFVMGTTDDNRRQRVGYFGSGNGIYFELSGDTPGFVKRSSVSGSVTNTFVPQTQWNKDKLDGTGESQIALDTSKAQIFWTDVEWLGVGTVRAGFVIDGQFIHCHSFDHANIINSTYITTACLPVRYEIENTGTTTSSGMLKEICATVISEGGYELRGLSRSISTPITGAYVFTSSGVNYPMVSIRLKSSPNRLDGIAIPNAISFIGQGNSALFNWKVIASGTTSGGSWTTTASGSIVDYNITATSISGGTVLAQGFASSDAQGKSSVELTTADLFKYQLQRNSFNNTPTELTFVVASKVNGDSGFAAIDWEEVTT